LAKDDFAHKSHNGARTEFFKQYIKTGILDKKYSKLYSNLMGKRQDNEYSDFLDFQEVDIRPLIAEAEEFIAIVRREILKLS
jgi:uncharacterized protein (UPF0332 family)